MTSSFEQAPFKLFVAGIRHILHLSRVEYPARQLVAKQLPERHGPAIYAILSLPNHWAYLLGQGRMVYCATSLLFKIIRTTRFYAYFPA
jgi:hypothetical protein